jgi:transcriptional regulator with XRE-family HTH domain
MEIHEKICLMRHARKWSQEDMAEKLSMSVNGYANIEHGDTDLQFSRLNQIAKVFGVDLLELFNLGEKGILCFIGENYRNVQNSNGQIVNYSDEQTELKHQIEKLQLMLENKEQVIESKEQEIKYLKKILELDKAIAGK